MAKTFYHGTVDLFLPDILKLGLLPAKKTHNIWHMQTPRGEDIGEGTELDCVYVSALERRAVEYAETRVRYFATRPGGKVTMFDTTDVTFVKNGDAPILRTRPVLLTIELPDDCDMKLDDRDVYDSSFLHKGHISPACIKKIQYLDDPSGERIVDNDEEQESKQGLTQEVRDRAEQVEFRDFLQSMLGL